MRAAKLERCTVATLLSLLACGCNAGRVTRGYQISSGDPDRGRQLIEGYGCGGCHTIPGVHNANGLVGPPLMFFSRRTMVAGELPNTPENLVRWIRNPRSVEPGTAMPDLGLSTDQANDIAAYLYTLR